MEILTLRFKEAYDYLKKREEVSDDTDFAQKLEVSRALITEILKERSKPGTKVLQNLVKNFQINGSWLLGGDGKIRFDQTETAQSYIAHTPGVSVANDPVSTVKRRKKVSPTVSATVSPTRNLGVPQVVTVDLHGKDTMVFVGARARAGYLTGYADPEYISTLPTYRLPGVNNGNHRLWEVEGASMHPTLKHGNIVVAEWVESFEDMRDERVYVLVTQNDGIVIKRGLQRIEQYGGIIAKSDNANKALYPNLHIAPEEIKEIWYARMYMSADFSAPTDLYNRLSNLEADFFMLSKHLKEKGI